MTKSINLIFFEIFPLIGNLFTKIAVSRSCKDSSTYKGYKENADICAWICADSSDVFVYGKTDKMCSFNGCACWCINGATKEGKCLKPYAHPYIDTYRINGKSIS